jgi:D-3-phosphoglycerate dehydrogenase
MSFKVLIADKISDEACKILQDAGLEVTKKTGLDEDALAKEVQGFDAILVRSAVKVTRKVIEAGKSSLKVIGRAGVGVDNIDVQAAKEANILVMNVPQGNSIAAAEHAIGLMFAMARMIPQAMQSLQGGEWERSKFVGVELCGKRLGVIGFGAVGRIVADRALGLKMHVSAYDPAVPTYVMEAMGVLPALTLDELLPNADIVSLHATLTPATRGLINKETISKMKKGAMLINTARGALVDEEALLDALNSGHISFAALDVFSKEPPPKDNSLLHHPRVIVTPHLGASTHESQRKVALAIARQVRDYLLNGVIAGAV